MRCRVLCILSHEVCICGAGERLLGLALLRLLAALPQCSHRVQICCSPAVKDNVVDGRFECFPE